jgi:hypothetical protein
MLPEPWLPLKKGQTLVNGLRAGGARFNDANQGVVLNLRTRYSVLRGKTRARRLSRSATDGSLPDVGPSNPWIDTRTGRVQQGSQPQSSNLSHRLSFDPGSGVIALPEGGDWLTDEDSEDDYGSVSPTPEAIHTPNNASQENLTVTNGRSPSTPLASPSKRRHGTYFHHPERRRQTIPGDFPFPTSS